MTEDEIREFLAHGTRTAKLATVGRSGAPHHQLGDAAWEGAWEEGRAMALEDAVSYALEDGADD
jgi:hypothetical protein